MALIPHIYFDAGLTDQFDDATDTLPASAISAGSGTGSFYVGTPTSGNRIQAASDPGVDNITVSITDSAIGADVEAAHIKLAITEGGLTSATGGDALSIGAQIDYGSPVRVWYQWDNSIGSGVFTEISLDVSARTETAI